MSKEYEWKLQDLEKVKKNGLKVFSCFACGGGSTMGYKLAGYEVLGCNEIDPKLMATYIKNHHPKYSFLEPIQTFKLRDDLPEELYHLDILDGSPPCSNFSMAGNREKDWGKEKKFREGQTNQVLDTLFFDFIDLTKKLQPKVVVSENVKGLLLGNATKYVSRIYDEFDKAGYYTKQFLLDASTMGVPQRRVRVFFISIRKDLMEKIGSEDLLKIIPKLNLKFNDPKIPYKDIEEQDGNENAYGIIPGYLEYWKKVKPGRTIGDVHPKGNGFTYFKLHPDLIVPTLRAGSNDYTHYEKERHLFDREILKASTFPLDYNLCGSKAIYICGMSVPPLMIKKISQEIYNQWFTKLSTDNIIDK